jgi:hypothetical protein
MNTNANLIEDEIKLWYNHIRSVNSLTEIDCYNLKDHLLDTIDELKACGLNDIDAFEVATIRIGKDFNFEEKYATVNSDTILIRKIIQILSGIMVYFLLYFTMNLISRMIIYYFHSIIDPELLGLYIFIYVLGYHLIIVILTLFIYTRGNEIFRKIETLKIKPLHIIILIILVFGIAFADIELQLTIKDELAKSYLLNTRFYSILGYSSYSFPSVMAGCFLILLRKNKLSGSKKLITRDTIGEEESREIKIKELGKKEYIDQLEELKKIGLDEEEAVAVVLRRSRTLYGKNEKEGNEKIEIKSLKTTMIALTGILVYLLLYYLMHATTLIFLIFLQYFYNDPIKNFEWVRWYIASFLLILIFFTTSIYLKDRNLIQGLKKLSFNPYRISMIIFASIFFIIVERIFFIIARNSLGDVFELKMKLQSILQFSDLSFSFVILMCFLILFNKYYNENIKTY